VPKATRTPKADSAVEASERDQAIIESALVDHADVLLREAAPVLAAAATDAEVAQDRAVADALGFLDDAVDALVAAGDLAAQRAWVIAATATINSGRQVAPWRPSGRPSPVIPDIRLAIMRLRDEDAARRRHITTTGEDVTLVDPNTITGGEGAGS
jgi:hypothetical protein